MTLQHIFIAWVCVTLYLCVIFFYELWRHKNGYYDSPKASPADEPLKTPVPRKEPPTAPAVAEGAPRSSQVPRQNPPTERHEELMDWLIDHRKRDTAPAIGD